MARENREKRNAAALGRGFVEWSVDPFENGTTEQPEPQRTGEPPDDPLVIHG